MSGTEEEYHVFEPTLLGHVMSGAGYCLGWLAYVFARFRFFEWSEALVDDAILLRRANPGAIRAIGIKSGYDGHPAQFRGRLLIHGRIGPDGPFAGNGFFATYHVAAPNKARALMLIRRFEWDAIPESLEIDDGELDIPDPGAEGVLWIQPGRSFYAPDF